MAKLKGKVPMTLLKQPVFKFLLISFRLVIAGTLLFNIGVATTPAHAASADITVDISHSGDFNVSGTGIFNITVSNIGDDITSGTTNVTITLPQGVNLDPLNPAPGENGTGWDCDTTVEDPAGADTVVCTSSEVVGFPPDPNSYPALSITVRIETGEFAPGQYPNQRTVSVSVSGGSDSNSGNNSDTDNVNIIFSDLIITNVTVNPAIPLANEPFSINVTVKNNGTGSSESVVDRDVWVNVNPNDFVDPIGCADAIASDFYRSDFNSVMPSGYSEMQPVSTLENPSSNYGSSLPAGIYQIYVMVDANCINQETDETNNIVGPIILRVGPPPVCGQIFSDVSNSYWACSWIETLYSYSITGGCATSPSLAYCPDNPVTRAQMAVFLEKGKHTPNPYSPPNVAPTFFDTVGHWAEDWIEALKNDNITSGCAPGLYCPDSATTRAQMAVFLLKSKYGVSYTPPPATGVFADVPTSHWAAAWIEKLAADGITSGCGGGNYCPESPVTRAQMAVFLVRTFNLP